ncbi:MAG TPA: hypothetical protein VKS21_08745, partial [Spirochaetota bacterium]|nr:hypothetical protein [Spirochaetota bacterium]
GWVQGYLAWSDEYFRLADYKKAEAILKAALNEVDIADRIELLLRLSRIYEVQKNHKAHKEILERIKNIEKVQQNIETRDMDLLLKKRFGSDRKN